MEDGGEHHNFDTVQFLVNDAHCPVRLVYDLRGIQLEELHWK